MISALFYLRLTSLRNATLARFRRLKQPKYLIGALVGAFYFYAMFFRRLRGTGAHSPNHFPFPTDLLPMLGAIGAVILMVIVAVAWLLPEGRAGLIFTEAEIAFLFPAPARRRTLILYKLINSQVAILFTAAIITLITGSWAFLGGSWFTHLIGWWIILATLNLHTMGASFVMTQLMDKGITPWRRRWAILGLLALIALVTVGWLWRDLRAPQSFDFTNFRTIAAYLNTVLESGPLPWLLLPARFVVAPFLAPDTNAFLLAVGPALVVFAIHVWWVLRSEVSFEDASIAKSEKRAARVAAVREGNWRAASGTRKAHKPAFTLKSTGRPELAFLWKNLLSTHSLFRLRTLGISTVVILVGCRWLGQMPEYRVFLGVIGMIAALSAAYILFLGPQIMRQDLRNDLLNADILKTYPLQGWQVVLGEILTPVTLLTGMLWLALLTLLLTFHPHQLAWLTPDLRFALGLGLFPLIPVLVAMELLVPNAAAVLFPAWVQSMRNRSERGIEMLGQRLIFVGGQFLVMLFALLPAALGAGLLIFCTQWLIGGTAAVIIAAIVVLIILVAEVGCGIWWLGQRFDKFDLSTELRP
ncbi:MAG: putative ABC exporter domain-containing protein [Opitutaceae bacterium]